MRAYKGALEILEPLDELGEDILREKMYLQALTILNNYELSNDDKATQLLDIYSKEHQLSYLIFDFLFKTNPKLAWEHFDSSQSEILVDILWQIEVKNLDLDIISKNSFLRELYTARGDLGLATRSSVFELDVLINLKNTSVSANLNFEYLCESCKQVHPFAFNRCSYCHSIDTSRVEWSLVKDYHRDFSEENNSFQ
jgi:hypothetical protein